MSGQNATIKDILEQAIQFEEQAYDFYVGAIKMVKQPHVQATLKDLAAEEVKHKEKLQALVEGNVDSAIAVSPQKVQDLKLAEYLVAPALGDDATFQDVLVVAMHREKSSNEFYGTMATIATDENTKKLFEFLAQEELVHKNKVESLYDEVVYQDN